MAWKLDHKKLEGISCDSAEPHYDTSQAEYNLCLEHFSLCETTHLPSLTVEGIRDIYTNTHGLWSFEWSRTVIRQICLVWSRSSISVPCLSIFFQVTFKMFILSIKLTLFHFEIHSTPWVFCLCQSVSILQPVLCHWFLHPNNKTPLDSHTVPPASNSHNSTPAG